MSRFFIYTTLLLSVFCGIFLLFLADKPIAWGSREITAVDIGGEVVRVDVADTPEMRAQGLSGRHGLAPDEGLLFVFEEDGPHSFWMKDMLFSIDIVWLSSDGAVVDIASDVSPDTYPSAFTPESPARYVLELPAGFAREHTIEKGDIIKPR